MKKCRTDTHTLIHTPYTSPYHIFTPHPFTSPQTRYDSLTGTPSCQRTVAFEKACLLFNLGALYTQLGARHDRTSAAGLDAAANNFLRAAGMFRYLHDTFTNAPSKDLSPEILEMLIHLMLVSSLSLLLSVVVILVLC